jgi:hypothetical protein
MILLFILILLGMNNSINIALYILGFSFHVFSFAPQSYKTFFVVLIGYS